MSNNTEQHNLTVTRVDLPIEKLDIVENTIHDLHIMDATFLVAAYDKSGNILGKMMDHPFTRKLLKERDVAFTGWRVKPERGSKVTSFRFLIVNPTQKIKSYFSKLNIALNFLDGKFDSILSASL